MSFAYLGLLMPLGPSRQREQEEGITGQTKMTLRSGSCLVGVDQSLPAEKLADFEKNRFKGQPVALKGPTPFQVPVASIR